MNRYATPENEDFEPGSNNQVLKNYFGIKSQEEIEILETQKLKKVEFELISFFDENHRFTQDDICLMHKLWLQDIYPFAGSYRTVNMAKGGFLFANANLIENLMKSFEKKYLSIFTPCKISDLDELAKALGTLHVELILIHPFREGNGRIARLLSILMSLQAGKPPLNFISIDQTKNLAGYRRYISAIHAGHVGNYDEIQLVFKEILISSNN